jgi:hypothetical protein
MGFGSSGAPDSETAGTQAEAIQSSIRPRCAGPSVVRRSRAQSRWRPSVPSLDRKRSLKISHEVADQAKSAIPPPLSVPGPKRALRSSPLSEAITRQVRGACAASYPTHVVVRFIVGPSFVGGQPEPVSGQTNPQTSGRVRPLSDGEMAPVINRSHGV